MDTWKNIENICVTSGIVFDEHFQRSRKSWKLFDYGLGERNIEVEGQYFDEKKKLQPLAGKTNTKDEATLFLRQGF